MAIKVKRYSVKVRQKPIKVKGAAVDFTDRIFTVYGKTERGVRSSIKNAGISGKIIEVKEIG